MLYKKTSGLTFPSTTNVREFIEQDCTGTSNSTRLILEPAACWKQLPNPTLFSLDLNHLLDTLHFDNSYPEHYLIREDNAQVALWSRVFTRRGTIPVESLPACVIPGKAMTLGRVGYNPESFDWMPCVGEQGYEFDLDSLPRVQHDVTAFLLSYHWEKNHQHWLAEALPRLETLIAFQERLKKVNIKNDAFNDIKLLFSTHTKSYQLEAVKRLGFSEKQFLIHDPYKVSEIRTLIIPGFIGQNFGRLRPEVFDVAQRLCDSVELHGDEPERIYVSRQDVVDDRGIPNKRHMRGEEEFIEILKKHGFTSICPGELSLEDEIRIFKGARIIIGPIGAGMSNIFFASPGSVIWMLQSPYFGLDSPWFNHVATQRGCYYGIYIGNCVEDQETPDDPNNHIWEIDLDLIQKALPIILKKAQAVLRN